MSPREPLVASAGIPRPTFGARRRIAMLNWAGFGIVAGALVLGVVDLTVSATPAERIFIDTLWWSLAAFVGTALLIDQSIHAPTAEGGLWVAFSAAVCFAVLLVLFGATHSAYSRVALAASFVAVTAWLLAGTRLYIPNQLLRLGVPEPSSLRTLEAARDALHGAKLTHVEAELVASDALEVLRELDGVVIDRRTEKSEALQRVLTQLKLNGVRIYSVDHIHELLTGRLALAHTEDGFLDDSSGRVVYSIVKRCLDLVSAIVLLLVLGLPMIAIAIAIRLHDHEAALFRQSRVGRGGHVFRMLKFRTMSRVVEETAVESGEAPADDRARITSLGRLLRRSRLDELPQLLNVLDGSMSLIGPRPEWTKTAGQFFDRIPHYPYRHLVRPGITGWAQVNQGHVTALPDAMIKLELDLYYVKHMSFALDLVVGVRTLRTIVTGHGAR